jgi:4-hydroxybenzoate polyprenyltransferase
LYSAAVLLWVSGFDIIYALQDEAFDRSMKLNSIPVSFGKPGGLQLSSILHVACALTILTASWLLGQKYPSFGWLHWGAAFIFIGLLFYQHTLVKPNDLSRINLAFFTTNGIASLIFGLLVILDIFV